MVRVFVPATIGNVGPGFDVLGLAVEGLGDTIEVEITGDTSSVVSVTGRDAHLIPMDAKLNAVVIAAEKLLEIKGINKGVRVSIERELPVSGGLGSSAAASVGGALGAAVAAGIDFSTEDIIEAALLGEESVAGRHLDNIAPCILGGLCMVLSVSPPDIYQVSANTNWWITLMTPNIKLDTKKARKVLPQNSPTKEWVQNMSHSVGLVTAFTKNDSELMRKCLINNFAEIHRSPLIPDFTKIKQISIESGALGCSISGAGPTMFSISTSESIANGISESIIKEFGKENVSCHVGKCSAEGAKVL